MRYLQKIVNSPFCDKLKNSEICLLGIPYDSGDFERWGSNEGPDAVRKALWKLYGWDEKTKKSVFEKSICDLGNVVFTRGDLKNAQKRVKKIVEKINKKKIISLLGEHTMSAIVLEKLKVENVVVLDAHLDMWDDYDGFKWSPACTIRRMIDLGKKITVCGVRDASKEEYDSAKVNNVKINEIGEINIKNNFYLSLDMDVFDPSIAPACVCPRNGGLKYEEVSKFVKNNANKIVGLDISGICPNYDNGETAILAAQIIIDFLTNQ